MSTTAKDLMVTPSSQLRPDLYLPEAFDVFREAFAAEGEVVGLVVVDEKDRLVGVLTMYDIFLFCLPKNIELWGAMEDMELMALVEKTCKKAKGIKVEEVMTLNPVSVTPDTPLPVLLDIFIKNHIRRIPVVEDGRMVGLVYGTFVFCHIMDQVSDIR